VTGDSVVVSEKGQGPPARVTSFSEYRLNEPSFSGGNSGLGNGSVDGVTPAKIRAIREIRGKNRGMKHEKLTGEIPGAAMAVLNFKEAKPAWKRVVRGPAEAETGS
jgi:hypothetical protein